MREQRTDETVDTLYESSVIVFSELTEDIFSVAKVKTYFQSSMTQERLNHLLLLYCHEARIDSMDLSQIAAIFVAVNEWRRQHFGIA